MVEQWSKDIGELCGSLNALCVVPVLRFQEEPGKQRECASDQDVKPFTNLGCNDKFEAGAVIEVINDEAEGCWICGQHYSNHPTLPMIHANCEKECGKNCS